MGELTFRVYDDMWPKLRIVGEWRGPGGNRVIFEERAQYDVAYLKFEGALHNQLRPLIEAVIARRKNPSGTPSTTSTQNQTNLT